MPIQPASEPAHQATPEQEEALRSALEKQKKVLLDYAMLRIRNAGLAHKYARVEELAREAVQIALENVIKKAHVFDPSRPASPWLKAFIYNAVRTLQKRENKQARMRLVGDVNVQRHRDEEYDLTDEDLFAFLGKADGRVEAHEEDPWLEWIREYATPDDSAVVELRYQGYTGEALARELSNRLGRQLSTGAAALRLHRAIERLRALYRKQQNL